MQKFKLMIGGMVLGMVVTSVMASGIFDEAGTYKASQVAFSAAK